MRNSCVAVCMYALCALLVRPAMAAPPSFEVRDLGTLGGRFTEAADINELGDVTGYSETADGQIHAFIYSHGEMRDVGTLGGTGSLARAINDVGQVTGFSLTASGEAH